MTHKNRFPLNVQRYRIKCETRRVDSFVVPSLGQGSIIKVIPQTLGMGSAERGVVREK
jgi:hypothetical protein